MTPIGTISELGRATLTKVAIEGESAVVVAAPEGFRVIVNRCPHQQAEILHEGTIEAGGLTCPLHGRTFDLADGRCRNGAGRLTFIPCKVVGDVLWAGPVPSREFPSF